jgi:DNA-binding transcriptional ArsR family regulator
MRCGQREICGSRAHSARLEILDPLSEEEQNRCQLLETLKIPKANLSQHLSVLREAGLIKSRRKGLFPYF